MCMYVSHSCTRHITHMLHMHILHGKSLEAKQMHLSLRYTHMHIVHRCKSW